jgi:hypothetical protein
VELGIVLAGRVRVAVDDVDQDLDDVVGREGRIS